jgi:hypothetical protein
MFTVSLAKDIHHNTEYVTLSHLGEGILFDSWTVNHGKENAQYRSHTTYFDSPAECETEIIRRAASRLESGWTLGRADSDF